MSRRRPDRGNLKGRAAVGERQSLQSTDFGQIRRLMPEAQSRLLHVATSGDYTTPTCPNCDDKMIERTDKDRFFLPSADRAGVRDDVGACCQSGEIASLGSRPSREIPTPCRPGTAGSYTPWGAGAVTRDGTCQHRRSFPSCQHDHGCRNAPLFGGGIPPHG